MKLPNVLIIGAQKSGTTSIYDWLGQHPDVYANPAAKDFPFFCNDTKYAEGIEGYAELFKAAASQRIILAGCVNDLFFPLAPARIHEHLPDAKIIVVVRNPIDRAFSAYRYAVERGLEKRGFDQAIDDELRGAPYEGFFEQSQKSYLEHGQYATQIERFREYFTVEKIKVFVFDDVKKNPQIMTDELTAFLELPAFTPEFVARNVTKGGYRSNFLRWMLFDQALRRNRMFAALKNLFSPELKRRLRTTIREFNKKSVEIPAPTTETKRLLRDYFRDEIGRLGDITSRDLSHWLPNR